MKLVSIVFVSALLGMSCASAQTPQPQGSPEVLALQTKLMQELQGNLQCTTQFIALQQKEAKISADLTKAQNRIKELEKTPETEKK